MTLTFTFSIYAPEINRDPRHKTLRPAKGGKPLEIRTAYTQKKPVDFENSTGEHSLLPRKS